MNITIAGSATNRKYDQDQIESISIELSAFDAEIASTSLPIPDPAGTDAVVSGRNVQIIDDYVAGTPPTYTTFLDGFVIAQPRERGPAVAPPNRLTTYTVQDANALLYGMVANKWVRPAETDVARILAAAAAFWPTLDTTWVLGEIAGTPPRNSPVAMTAKTYDTDQLVSELSTDTVDASGKTLFARSAGGTRFLHYHALDEGPTATISLDSTDGVADYSTIFPFTLCHRDADGLELGYKVIARNSAGLEVTVTDTTSQTAHHADGRSFEKLVDFPDAADTTALTLLANEYLAQNKAERLTFFVEHVGPFTAAQAASIGPGFLIPVTSDVLGLTDSLQRIAHLTWKYKHPGIWFADMELGMPLRQPKNPRKHTPFTGRSLQKMEITVHGDGVHVQMSGNTYNTSGNSGLGNLSTIPQTATLTSGNWYRVYYDVTGSCFPSGGGCYGGGVGWFTELRIGRSVAGQFTAPAPNWGLSGSSLGLTIASLAYYGSGHVDCYANPAPPGIDSVTLGTTCAVYLHAYFNLGDFPAAATVWLEDLGPGDGAGPYASPPPVLPIPPPAVAPVDSGPALGDLFGAYPAPTVAAIQGTPVSATPPTGGQGLVYNAISGQYEPTTAVAGLTVDDEGTPLATLATSIDFVGAGVTASGTGAAKTITIPGPGTGFVTNTLGGKEVVDTIAALGATHTLDLAGGNVFDATLTAACTLTFAGATVGVACSFSLLLRQDGTGGWTTTWPGSVVWADGTAPTLDETLSTVAVLTFFTLDGGTVWYGFPTGGGSAVAALDDLTDVAITAPAVGDMLRWDGAVWVNTPGKWEPVTTNPGAGPELVWSGDSLVMNWNGA